MIGACQLGANRRRVAKWLKLKEGEKKKFERYWRNLRRNGVFVGGKVAIDPENPAVDLCCLGLVAEGLLKRREAE